MRSDLFATALSAVLSTISPALAYPIRPVTSLSAELMSAQGDPIAILDYSHKTVSARFTVPRGRDADDALVLDLHLENENGIVEPERDVHLNGIPLHLTWEKGHTYSTHVVRVSDISSVSYIANFTVRGTIDQDSQNHALFQDFHFHFNSLDKQPVNDLGFVLATRPLVRQPLRHFILESSQTATAFVEDMPTVGGDFLPEELDDLSDDDTIGPSDDTESIRVLALEALDLKTQIIAKKLAISKQVKNPQSPNSLKSLLEECDGLVCAARVVAQRICDKVGDAASSSTGYAKMQNSRFQQMVESVEESIWEPTTAATNDGPNQTGQAQAASLPLQQTKKVSSSNYHFHDFVYSNNPLVRALQVIGAVLGLVALYSFVRRKCMSMRKRVERAADEEERRNARAYRRAARRVLMRKRWDGFVNGIKALNCFRANTEPRNEDYEEKRALILQDAFLEQMSDLETAEKGELMEAEIRELRHAHEIVASLVRVTGDNDIRTHYAHASRAAQYNHNPLDGPAPPYGGRSRASTGTLPSYTSESLPDYTSRPATLASSIAGGYTTSTPDSNTLSQSTSVSGDDDTDSYVSPPSTTTSSNGIQPASTGRCSPTSSIVDVSPRPSDETIRTRGSRDPFA